MLPEVAMPASCCIRLELQENLGPVVGLFDSFAETLVESTGHLQSIGQLVTRSRLLDGAISRRRWTPEMDQN